MQRRRRANRTRSLVLRLEQLETRLPLAGPVGLADITPSRGVRITLDAGFTGPNYESSEHVGSGGDLRDGFDRYNPAFNTLGPADNTDGPSEVSVGLGEVSVSLGDVIVLPGVRITIEESRPTVVAAAPDGEGNDTIGGDQSFQSVLNTTFGHRTDRLTHLQGVEPQTEGPSPIAFPEPSEGLIALITVAGVRERELIGDSSPAPDQLATISRDDYFVSHEARGRAGWTTQSEAGETRQHVSYITTHAEPDMADHTATTPIVLLPAEITTLATVSTTSDGRGSGGSLPMSTDEVSQDASRVHDAKLATTRPFTVFDGFDLDQLATKPTGLRDMLLATYHPLTILLGASFVSAHLMLDSQTRPTQQAKTRQRLRAARIEE